MIQKLGWFVCLFQPKVERLGMHKQERGQWAIFLCQAVLKNDGYLDRIEQPVGNGVVLHYKWLFTHRHTQYTLTY